MTRKQGFLCFCVLAFMAAVAVPITLEVVPITRDLDTEAQITAQITAVKNTQSQMDTAGVEALVRLDQLIADANAITAKTEKIHSDMTAYLKAAKTTDTKTIELLAVADTYMNTKALEEKKQWLVLLKAIHEIGTQVFAHETTDSLNAD